MERFAKELLKKGRKVAILSRGYKSKQIRPKEIFRIGSGSDISPPRIVSDSSEVFLNSEDAMTRLSCLLEIYHRVVVLTDKNRVAEDMPLKV